MECAGKKVVKGGGAVTLTFRIDGSKHPEKTERGQEMLGLLWIIRRNNPVSPKRGLKIGREGH